MIVEEAELAAGTVDDLVAVDAACDVCVRAADAHAHAVALALQDVGLGPAVTRHRSHLKWHLDETAAAVVVVGWEVPVDSVLDPDALGLHLDALVDFEDAVVADVHVAVKIDDALGRRAEDAPAEQDEPQNDAPHRATRTASRSSVSKNGSGRKPSIRATIRSGKLSMRVRYCFTAPL